MRRTQGSAVVPDEVRAIERRGNNITKNVSTRMITPQERALLLESPIIPEPLEQAISSRLAACVRDEAIWQYHIGRGRGLVLWTKDRSFRYIPISACGGVCGTNAMLHREIGSLVQKYHPAKEAVVLAEYASSEEILCILEDGRFSSYCYETGDWSDAQWPPQRRWWTTRETNSLRNSERCSVRYSRPVSTTR
jgi:hypothetical protein